MLFEGINRIYRDYGVFDYPRSGGSRHNGMDIDGVNSFVIRMPSFNGKTISGTVTRSRIVTDHSDSTWEWGYYVTVKLSTPQTVDGTAIHYLTFAHNARNLVSDGDTVTTGTPLAIAGKTGNAEGEHMQVLKSQLVILVTCTCLLRILKGLWKRSIFQVRSTPFFCLLF